MGCNSRFCETFPVMDFILLRWMNSVLKNGSSVKAVLLELSMICEEAEGKRKKGKRKKKKQKARNKKV